MATARKKKNSSSVIHEVADEGTSKVHMFRCSRCGKEVANPVGAFYKATSSEKYKSNDGYATVCVNCIRELFYEYKARYGSTQTAVMLCCHILDIPFVRALLENILLKNDTTYEFGRYMRSINIKQYNGKTFINTIMDGELNKSTSQVKEELEVSWSDEEKSNMDTAITIVGYDPFEGYSNNDRRILFNEVVKFFDDDIVDDPYKLSQIIQIVINNHQIRELNLVIAGLNPKTDSVDIKDLNQIKNILVSSNDKIAKENEISVKNRSNKQAGKSSLTYLMKKLREEGFEDAEQNYYDQLTSKSSRWAAEVSFKSLSSNGLFDDNDYNDIIAEQNRLIKNIQLELDTLKEANRINRLQVVDLQQKYNDEEIAQKYIDKYIHDDALSELIQFG